jgi:outer membrane protein OmpA-like peptidoglycan-associated protein
VPFVAAPHVALPPPVPAPPPIANPPQTSSALTGAAPQTTSPIIGAPPQTTSPLIGGAPQEGLSFVAASPDAYARTTTSGALAQARHSAALAAKKWKALPRRTQAIIAAAALVLSSSVLIIAFASRSNDASAEPARGAAREQAQTPTTPATATIGKNEGTVSNAPNPSPAAPALPAESARTQTDLRELTTLPLTFERATEAYSVSDAERLSRIVQALREALEKDAGARVEVGGHASREGNAHFNWEVAGRRAAAVRDYLQQQGIASNRIKVRSYGTVRPLNAGEREENRRVTVRLLQSTSP